jgi:YHS domain-containing protein
VARALSGHAEIRAVPLGAVRLKNIAQPVAVWSLLEGGSQRALTGEVDPVCRMRLTAAEVFIEEHGRRHAFCSDACADRFRSDPSLLLETSDEIGRGR